MKKKIEFSRLLKVFKVKGEIAYIIELKEGTKKTLYISYSDIFNHHFESYEKSRLKKEFEDLSDHCLLKDCTNADFMFNGSPITHFTGNCEKICHAESMFLKSNLEYIDAKFPMLEYGGGMFSSTKIENMAIDFPNLLNGTTMFFASQLKEINSEFEQLVYANFMFCKTNIKQIKIKSKKLERANSMFLESKLERCTIDLSNIKEAGYMFGDTPLKEFELLNGISENFRIQKGFDGTADQFKMDYPHYFV